MGVLALKQEFETIGLMVREAIERYPNARNGVIVVFDEKGDMHMMFHCNAQQLALASVRLAYIANED